jgi:hypothetical protein
LPEGNAVNAHGQMSTNNAKEMRLHKNVHKNKWGKQKVTVGQRKGFMKWKDWIKCKKQEARR